MRDVKKKLKKSAAGRSPAEGVPLLVSLASTMLVTGVVAVVRKLRRNRAARRGRSADI